MITHIHLETDADSSEEYTILVRHHPSSGKEDKTFHMSYDDRDCEGDYSNKHMEELFEIIQDDLETDSRLIAHMNLAPRGSLHSFIAYQLLKIPHSIKFLDSRDDRKEQTLEKPKRPDIVKIPRKEQTLEKPKRPDIVKIPRKELLSKKARKMKPLTLNDFKKKPKPKVPEKSSILKKIIDKIGVKPKTRKEKTDERKHKQSAMTDSLYGKVWRARRKK